MTHLCRPKKLICWIMIHQMTSLITPMISNEIMVRIQNLYLESPPSMHKSQYLKTVQKPKMRTFSKTLHTPGRNFAIIRDKRALEFTSQDVKRDKHSISYGTIFPLTFIESRNHHNAYPVRRLRPKKLK
jgi:hypothetical protein